ncbi:WYL domain-containing protein [Microbacterium betulae]|uniref:WYL domain-containing protein n=1 Tax=Microbacterium betulae TaxID=2981139 RepID=A0AA97FK17_9MICO|nr:WYL domain-containing protein [Microbacterium sp. AB]WOF24490.1 WYL domain-containing protein [Microbacterium sp. AB]
MTARTPLLASDQVRILLTLVPFLFERGEVTVEDAAAEFEVTPAQMRRIVQRLPLIGLPGADGYYQMPNEMFEIDWDLLEEQDVILINEKIALDRAPRLTAREAAALLAGLQLASGIPGVAGSDVFGGLVDKLARGASAAPAELVVASGPVDEVRSIVARALKAGVAVSFTYRAPDAGPTTRTVDPVKILITGGQWYLQGWCHLRRAMRTFHLDRVGEARLTDIPSTHRDGSTETAFGQNDGEQVAVVRFPAEIAPLLGDYLHHAEIEEGDGVATARIRLADAQSLKRIATRLGGRAEIVSPPPARRAAAEWAEAALALYGTD